MQADENNRQYRRIPFRKGNEYLLFKPTEVAYIYLRNKLCVLIERSSGAKITVTQTLKEVESLLDASEFYRINKNWIVHIDSVEKYKLLKGGKAEIILNPSPREKVFISQLKITDFRGWVMDGNKIEPRSEGKIKTISPDYIMNKMRLPVS